VGHVANAEELLRDGLVDGICSLNEAKTELILRVWFGEEFMKNGDKDTLYVLYQ